MVDRLEDFRQICGVGLTGAYPAPPIPPCLSEWLSLPKPPAGSLSPSEQQQLQQLSWRFLAVASACSTELDRVQTQIRRGTGLPSGLSRGYLENAEAKTVAGRSRRALSREEIAVLLRQVAKQQREAQTLGALSQDLSDLRALHALRASWSERVFPQQGGGNCGKRVELRDAIAHREQVMRSLDAAAKELTAQLKKKEVEVLKLEMESARHFSAAAASRRVEAEGSRQKSGKFVTAGAAAAEAAEFVSQAMRRQTDKKNRASQQQVALEEAEAQSAESEVQRRLQAEEANLLRELQHDRVEAIVEVQRQLQEVVQTMDVFSFKVEEQAEVCEQIHALAEEAAKNVDAAHSHLMTALSRKSSFRQLVCYIMCLLGFLVVLIDYLKSSSPYLF